MNAILLVAVGGGVGAALRHLFGVGALKLFGGGFPFGTFGVNVLGSLLMGVLVAWLARTGEGGQTLRLLFATGLLGGFTTFSSYSLDIVTLYERGMIGIAMLYAFGSLALGVAALFGGLASGRSLF